MTKFKRLIFVAMGLGLISIAASIELISRGEIIRGSCLIAFDIAVMMFAAYTYGKGVAEQKMHQEHMAQLDHFKSSLIDIADSNIAALRQLQINVSLPPGYEVNFPQIKKSIQ